jgi:hypothetical protein
MFLFGTPNVSSAFATAVQLDEHADRLRLKVPCSVEDCLQVASVLHSTKRRPKRVRLNVEGGCQFEGISKVLAKHGVAAVFKQVRDVDLDVLPLSEDLAEVGPWSIPSWVD